MAESIDTAIADLDEGEALKDVLTLLELANFSTSAWEPGDPAYDLTSTVTTWGVRQYNRWIAPALRSQFLDRAEGVLLRLKAWADYNRPAKEETFGVGDVTIENRGSYIGAVAVGAIRVRNAGGKSFTNTAAKFVPLWAGSGPYPAVTFQVRADEAGSASNTAPNALPTFPTPLSAGPAGLYVRSNAALFGADGETDELLRDRCRVAAAERGMGPRDSYRSIALDPIGAMKRNGALIPSTWPPSVNIARARVVEPGNGRVTVFLGSLTGAAAGTASTADTDVFIAAVALRLLAAVPGCTLTVLPAVEVPINYGTIQIQVRAEALVSKAAAEAVAGAALAKFFRELAIGGEVLSPNGQGYVFHDHVIAAALSGAGAFAVTFSGVSTDVTLNPGEVAVPTYTVQAVLVTQGA